MGWKWSIATDAGGIPIGWAIDARRQRFPDETPFAYAPHAGESVPWDDAARAAIKDYNLLDLGI